MGRLLIISLLFLFYSCSPASRINKQARVHVIKDKSLQNAHVGISIYDPATQKSIYSYQSDKFFVPASNTKIPTCYVAMKYLPDSLLSYYYQTKNDTIYIQPAGDPTVLHPDFANQPSFDFLKNYRQVMIEDAGYTQFLGSGWSWNDYQENYMAQKSLLPLYGNIIRLSWINSTNLSVQPKLFQDNMQWVGERTNGFAVDKPWEENSLTIKPGNRKSASVPFRPAMETIISLLQDTLKFPVTPVISQTRLANAKYSQPKDSMLKPMMHRSDNFFAEQSLVMTAKQLMNSNSVSNIIDSVIKTDFGDLPQKPRWVDGSGLSRYNLFTPSSLVAILAKMQKEFGMERLKVIFPAAGEGTLNNFYKNYPDRFFAKTGTLSGVVALSGFMYTNKNRLLIFSVLVNNHQASATDVRRAVEKFLSGIMETE